MFLLKNSRPIRKAPKPDFIPDVVDSMTPALRRKWQAVLRKLSKSLTLKEIEDLFTQSPGLVSVALENKLNDLTPAILSETGIAPPLRNAVAAGAVVGLKDVPTKGGVALSFDLLNPRSVDFLQNYPFTEINQINSTTLEGIRDISLQAFNEGIPPKQAARMIQDSIGLTPKQMRIVNNFRTQLEEREFGTSTAPKNRMRLSPTERARAQTHILEDTLTPKQVDNLVDKYHNRLINMRAEAIARTELSRAANFGQQEVWRQGIDEGFLDPDTFRRFWVYTHDDRVRREHTQVPGLNSEGVAIGEDFTLPGGGTIHSPPWGVNCRCTTVGRDIEIE